MKISRNWTLVWCSLKRMSVAVPKQSFYACIRQHSLDEETNICYITLGVLVDLINYFKRCQRLNLDKYLRHILSYYCFLQLKLNISLRYSVWRFNFIITTAGCLEIELQESWTNTDFWGKNSNWLIVVFKRSDKITATHDLWYFLLKFTKLLKAFRT